MIATSSLFQMVPKPFLYFLTLVWAVFGLGGWAMVSLVVYWDSQEPVPTATAPLITEGCSSIKWMPPPTH